MGLTFSKNIPLLRALLTKEGGICRLSINSLLITKLITMNKRGAASRGIIARQQRTERRAIEAHLPQAVPEASIENQPFDLSSYMHDVNELDVDVDRTGSETADLESLDVT